MKTRCLAALLIAVIMVFGTAAAALADSESGSSEISGVLEGNSASIAVKGYASIGEYYGAVYCLTVSWTTTQIIYTESGAYKWDAENLKYDDSGISGEFTDGTVIITVTNYSDAAVEASLSYSDKESDGITTYVSSWTLEDDTTIDDGGSAELDSAAMSDGEAISYYDTSTQGTAVTKTFSCSVCVQEEFTELPEDQAVVGTVTLRLSAAEDEES